MMGWGLELLGLGCLRGSGSLEGFNAFPSLNFRFIGVVRGDIPSYWFGFGVVSVI